MSERGAPRLHHISSAVVTALPAKIDAVLCRIKEQPATEIYHVENSKIVIVLEGASTGEIGNRLAEIGLIDGVLSANMVFEQIEDLDDIGVEP